MVKCGVMRYLKRKRADLVSKSPSCMRFTPSLTVPPARSARSLDAVRCGALVTCFVLLCLQKSLNSSVTNPVALSLTVTSGMPCEPIVMADVEPDLMWASIHFECADIISRIILSLNKPALSICSRVQGRSGNDQGCSGTSLCVGRLRI